MMNTTRQSPLPTLDLSSPVEWASTLPALDAVKPANARSILREMRRVGGEHLDAAKVVSPVLADSISKLEDLAKADPAERADMRVLYTNIRALVQHDDRHVRNMANTLKQAIVTSMTPRKEDPFAGQGEALYATYGEDGKLKSRTYAGEKVIAAPGASACGSSRG